MAKMQAKECDRCGFLSRDELKFRQLAVRKRNERGNWEQDEVRDLCEECAVRLLTEWFRPAAQTAFAEMDGDETVPEASAPEAVS